ncbi:MAG: hypothetical protein PF572_02725 [Patescibacteria group bacterium]|jgi:hypothetical protein|nr:hypothetical protein [Patescibacteria group bacterium]
MLLSRNNSLNYLDSFKKVSPEILADWEKRIEICKKELETEFPAFFEKRRERLIKTAEAGKKIVLC